MVDWISTSKLRASVVIAKFFDYTYYMDYCL